MASMNEAPDHKEAPDDEWLKVALRTAAMRHRLHAHLVAEALRHRFELPPETIKRRKAPE